MENEPKRQSQEVVFEQTVKTERQIDFQPQYDEDENTLAKLIIDEIIIETETAQPKRGDLSLPV